MHTYKYKFIPEYPIKERNMYYFGQFWNGSATEEDGIETLLSGQIEMESKTETQSIYFTSGEVNEKDFRDTIIKIIEIKTEE